MNLFLGCVFVILSTYLGFCLGQKYTKIRKFYQDFSAFNKILQKEVSFGKNTLNYIIEKYKKNNYFCSFVENKSRDKNTFKNLNENQKQFVYSYVESLGQTDSVTQLKYLNSVNNEIEDQLNASIVNEKKYKQLYIKLGFLFGAIILIIFL